VSVFVKWARCAERGNHDDAPCGELVNFACDHCAAKVCVRHVSIGRAPEWPELCPACYAKLRSRRGHG
jgi:hypothetical protein